jgi:hypothetical protein
MTLNINSTAKTSVNPLWESFKKDAAANKLASAMEGNENIDFDIVEDTTTDDKLTTLKLEGDSIENMNVKVRVNADDIARVAKEKGIDKNVFLSQHIASVMSATYLMMDAIKKGKDPSTYLSNAEFLVATNLMADGVVRRTNKDAIPYLNKERAKLPERIKAEHGEIATSGGDALEVAEALGFVGINTGGWADKIVKGFGEKPDLEKLEETTKAENDDDSTVSDSDTDDTTETTDTETATKDPKETGGTKWWQLLLAGGAGFLASRFLGPKASKNGDDKKTKELTRQLEDQRNAFQKALAQQREQQLKAQADYQQQLKDYYAKLAVANTPAPTVPAPTLPVATMPYAQGFPLTYASSSALPYPLPTVASSVQLPAPISNDWV